MTTTTPPSVPIGWSTIATTIVLVLSVVGAALSAIVDAAPGTQAASYAGAGIALITLVTSRTAQALALTRTPLVASLLEAAPVRTDAEDDTARAEERIAQAPPLEAIPADDKIINEGDADHLADDVAQARRGDLS